MPLKCHFALMFHSSFFKWEMSPKKTMQDCQNHQPKRVSFPLPQAQSFSGGGKSDVFGPPECLQKWGTDGRPNASSLLPAGICALAWAHVSCGWEQQSAVTSGLSHPSYNNQLPTAFTHLPTGPQCAGPRRQPWTARLEAHLNPSPSPMLSLQTPQSRDTEAEALGELQVRGVT